MYATNEDKSLFNLGTWGVIQIPRNYFTPGIALLNETQAEQLKNKLVYIRPVSNWAFGKLVCQGITQPCLTWDVIHSNGGTDYFGLMELTEEEQEDAMKITDVFFSNDNIYVVADSQPNKTVYIRFKPI